MPEHSLAFGFQRDGAIIAKTVSIVLTDDLPISVDAAIPIGTDKEVLCPIDVGQLKSLYILADQDLTIQTNSGSAPDDTINLKANIPLVWELASGYFACPLTVDVVSIFVTNAAAAAAALKIRGSQDSTP